VSFSARPVVDGQVGTSRQVTPTKSLIAFARETFHVGDSDELQFQLFSETRELVDIDAIRPSQRLFLCKMGETPPGKSIS
jgi:hypothetical protein